MKNTLKSNSNHDPKQATFDEQVKITTWQFKLFSVILDKKIFSRSCEKLKNILLSGDYIKFDP
jgi:hypothetical protein